MFLRFLSNSFLHSAARASDQKSLSCSGIWVWGDCEGRFLYSTAVVRQLKDEVKFAAKSVSTICCCVSTNFLWPFWHWQLSEGHQQGPDWWLISGNTMFQKIKILWKVMVMVFKPQVTEVKGIKTIFTASLDSTNWCSDVFTLEVSDWGQSFNASRVTRRITTATLLFYGIQSSTLSF